MQRENSNPPVSHTVYLGLGSNLGDRLAHLAEALERLSVQVVLERISSVYETEPVGYLAQPGFLNCACGGKTSLSPHALLTFAKAIEREMGRQPSFRNAPRPIDIDILLYDTLQLTEEALSIPHPRMHERAFVLVPLAEIAPDLRYPSDSHTIRELLAGISQAGVTRSVHRLIWHAR